MMKFEGGRSVIGDNMLSLRVVSFGENFLPYLLKGLGGKRNSIKTCTVSASSDAEELVLPSFFLFFSSFPEAIP